MAAQIDLSKVFLKRVHGDLLAVYTWLNDERALVLIPHLRGADAPWYVVCESAAWCYDDPAHMAQRCVKAAEVLGMGADRSTWVRIATIINEGLPDLVRMPSFELWEQERAVGTAVGELTVRSDGQVVHQELVTVPADQGASYA